MRKPTSWTRKDVLLTYGSASTDEPIPSRSNVRHGAELTEERAHAREWTDTTKEGRKGGRVVWSVTDSRQYVRVHEPIRRADRASCVGVGAPPTSRASSTEATDGPTRGLILVRAVRLFLARHITATLPFMAARPPAPYDSTPCPVLGSGCE